MLFNLHTVLIPLPHKADSKDVSCFLLTAQAGRASDSGVSAQCNQLEGSVEDVFTCTENGAKKTSVFSP